MRDSDGQNVDFFQMEGNTENREQLGERKGLNQGVSKHRKGTAKIRGVFLSKKRSGNQKNIRGEEVSSFGKGGVDITKKLNSVAIYFLRFSKEFC